MHGIVSKGGRVLFVGTKRQAQGVVAESAKRCGQYYVNHRWLGGMMTNWKTITKSISIYRDLEDLFSKENTGLTKKELLQKTRHHNKLELSIGGVKDMGGHPDALFVIDVRKEAIAIQEAKVLGIPVFAIVDTNTNPENIDFPIPGNDDALRAIELYCNLFSEAILDGIQTEISAKGIDVEEKKELKEDLPKKKTTPKKAAVDKDIVATKEKPKKAAATG